MKPFYPKSVAAILAELVDKICTAVVIVGATERITSCVSKSVREGKLCGSVARLRMALEIPELRIYSRTERFVESVPSALLGIT